MVISYISAGLYLLLGFVAFFLSSQSMFSLPIAIILSIAGTVAIYFLESMLQKKRLAGSGTKLWWSKDILTKKQSIIEFVQIGISTLLINISQSLLYNDSYAVHYFGEYDGEYGFVKCFETVPEIASNAFLIISLLFYILVISKRGFLAFFSGVFAIIGVIANNTICQFGEYYIVAAAGNDSRRFNDVSEFEKVVTNILFVLAIGLLIVSVVDLIIHKKKGKKLFIVSIALILIGVLLIFGAFVAESKETTFDIKQRKIEIYGDAKAFSERFQEENFSNKFGTMSTKCVHPDCDMNIVTSGDSNCCIIHSNRCGNCNCYIDGDAMYCMDCMTGALSNKNSSSNNKCYMCGADAYYKYGSYYCCSNCIEIVNAFS